MSEQNPRPENGPRALRRFIAIGPLLCTAIILAAGWLGKSDTVHHGSGISRSTVG